MKARYALFLLIALVVTACSASGPATETAGPPADAVAPTSGPPTAAAQSPTVAAADGVVYGRNDDGTFFHGAPDAPVIFTDYSDFL
jgi:hypothetical protein